MKQETFDFAAFEPQHDAHCETRIEHARAAVTSLAVKARKPRSKK